MPPLPLPVLDQTSASRIAAELAALLPGQTRFGKHDRMLYATDASIYQVEPLGVIIPNSIDSMIRAVEYCGANKVPLLPRGGGTSLPGQCTNHAVVLDHSAFCRAVLNVDASARQCHVEPGITVDALNRHLDSLKTGLFYAPDPATAAQATIGGCIGNNAAGARSIRYGRTSESVLGVDVLLSTGQRTWLEAGAGQRSPIARDLAIRVAAVVTKYAPLIRARFPKTNRRNAGYGLDLIVNQLDRGVKPEDLDLSGLICGSEGTLALVLGAKLRLHPIPPSKGLAIVSFATLEAAIEAVVPILATNPSAVELLDDVVLGAARGNNECRAYMDLMENVDGIAPAAVLYVEYQENGPIAEVEAKFAALGKVLPHAPIRNYLDKKALLRAWALRKAGEPLLHGMSAHRKPLTCVEDNAVPVENLVRFVSEFKKIVSRHGTTAAYYAHASVGVLHVRPLLDPHDEMDLERLRAIATEVADLARDCGGVMSGEHGDGRLRGPLLERFFGPELMTAFREIKAIFDPPNILNPGNIVAAGPIESITENLRVKPAGQPIAWPKVDTYFDYADQECFVGALEMCSGAGVCRKTAGGSMCPSYRATVDERHTTRGRANALRLAISGQLPGGGAKASGPAWDDPDTLETLSLCLSCKACKTECPSNVDMARLKAEYTAQHYKSSGRIPLSAKVFGHVRALNRLGSIAPAFAGFMMRLPPVRGVMNRVLHLAKQRTLPAFGKSLYRWFEQRPATAVPAVGGPAVVLFGDCFVTYNEPQIGRHAVAILEKLGYRVAFPRVGCCGRSLISNGLLADAIVAADAVLTALAPAINDPAVKAIVVCEPSCLSAMKDDYLTLKLKTPMDLRRKLAAKAMALEEFIEKSWSAHPAPPKIIPNHEARPVVLHGHCHQKALWGTQATEAVLRRLVGDRLTVLPSGCCGMAGAFGYMKDKYDLSMAIGEQSLFSLLEDVPAETIVVAPGTSCRHQIYDGTARHALHPIELLADALAINDA